MSVPTITTTIEQLDALERQARALRRFRIGLVIASFVVGMLQGIAQVALAASANEAGAKSTV